jgi:uncharacterized protein (DUF4213/DUF364 family)
MNDILEELFLLNPYRKELIQKSCIGIKNVAIMLTNGCIGVCSTLGKGIDYSVDSILDKPDFTKHEHRIVVNAWINANSNYNIDISGNADINEAIDFSSFKKIVMIGYFGSLVDKLRQKDVEITVFDLNEEDKPVEPIRYQRETITNSDCIILTATSLSNLTFLDLFPYIPQNCKVLILGPSTPLSPLFFSQLNVSGLFGARFQPYDYDVLNSIEEGGGTRSFLKRMEKVFILNGL